MRLTLIIISAVKRDLQRNIFAFNEYSMKEWTYDDSANVQFGLLSLLFSSTSYIYFTVFPCDFCTSLSADVTEIIASFTHYQAFVNLRNLYMFTKGTRVVSLSLYFLLL